MPNEMEKILTTPTRKESESDGKFHMVSRYSPKVMSPDSSSPYLLSQNNFKPEIIWDGTSPNVIKRLKSQQYNGKSEAMSNNLTSLVSQLENGIKKFSDHNDSESLNENKPFELDLKLLPSIKVSSSNSKPRPEKNISSSKKKAIKQITTDLENLANRLKSSETASSNQGLLENCSEYFSDDDIFSESFIKSTQALEEAVWESDNTKVRSTPGFTSSAFKEKPDMKVGPDNKPKRKTFQLIASPKKISFQSNTYEDIAKCCAELDTSDDLFDEIPRMQDDSYCIQSIKKLHCQPSKHISNRTKTVNQQEASIKLKFISNVATSKDNISFSDEDVVSSVTKIEEDVQEMSVGFINSYSKNAKLPNQLDNEDMLLASMLDEVESQLPLSQSRCSREEIEKKRRAAISKRLKKIKSCDNL